MKTGHRYILEPYNGMRTRHICPSCGRKERSFVLYVDTFTGEYIHPSVGRCNHEVHCGYHYTPSQFFKDNMSSYDGSQRQVYRPRPVAIKTRPVSYIPVDIFKQSLQVEKSVTQVAESNSFLRYLIDLLGVEVADRLQKQYFIGTSKYQFTSSEFPGYKSDLGASVFWQIDISGRVRTGKIMLYDAHTGKRLREPFSHLKWAHKALREPEFELKQCLFGEHLLRGNTKPVAVVESEKTAIISSAYLPQFVWLAAGSLTNLNAEKCGVLKGRRVVLYPDLNGFDRWISKAAELSSIASFTVSNLLERHATEDEKIQGLDLADYLTRYDLRDFATPEPPTVVTPTVVPSIGVKPFEEIAPLGFTLNVNFFEPSLHESWERDITELDNFFSSATLPVQTVKLDNGSTITNIPLFIQSHLATIKANEGKAAFTPYLHRLQSLKSLLTTLTPN